MPNNIYHKRNANTGVVPTAAQLTVGEIALNTADGKAYTRTTAGTVVELTEASVADGGEQFTPLNISNLALWLDSSDVNSLYTTDAGPVTAVSSPLDIAGCGLWLDASNTGSLTLNENTVSEWRDLSGNGRHFSQATPAAQPNAVNRTQNGLRVLDFGGAQEMLGNAASLNIARNVGGVTIMAAIQFDVLSTIGTTRTAFIAATAANAVQARAALASVGGSANGLSAGGRRLDADSFGSATMTITVNEQNVATAILDYANSDAFIYRNGSLGASNLSFQTAGNTSDTDSLVVAVGSGNGVNFFDGWIGEIIVWPRVLTATERARAEAYLAAKWGISGVHTQATATSDPVGAWLDKSGNNRHATQTTAANRPTRAVASNNRNTLLFTGSSTAANAQRLAISNMPANNNELFSVFAVIRETTQTSGIAGRVAIGYRGPTFQYALMTQTVGVSSVYWYHAGDTPRFTTTPATATQIYVVQKTATTTSPIGVVLFFNGANATPVSLGNGGNFGLANFVTSIGSSDGGSNSFTGHICELIAFSRVVSTAERISIERYLADRWGITLAPQVANLDAQNWINRVYQNGGTVSQSTAAAVNTFCNAINAAGIRDRFYRLNLFCGDNLAACLVPLYRGQSLGGTQFGNTTDTNNNFAASDYNERGVAGGLRGNTSNKWLNTGFDANAAGLPINNAHMAAVWPTYLHPVNSNYMLVSAVNSAVNHRFWLNTSSNTIPSTEVNAHLGQGSTPFLARAQIAAANGSIIQGGLWVASRVSGTDLRLYNNATERASAAGSISEPAWPTNPVSVFARWDGTSTFGHSGINLWGYSVGLGLSAAQVTSFNTAMQTFQTTLARNV